jgi:hypothetical protein
MANFFTEDESEPPDQRRVTWSYERWSGRALNQVPVPVQGRGAQLWR